MLNQHLPRNMLSKMYSDKAQALELLTVERANKGSNFFHSGMAEHTDCIQRGTVCPSITLLSAHRVMCDDIYIPLWREYKAMGLSASGVLNFQEQMIYHFPGKILSACGTFEIPKPCVISLWKDRRNVTNYLQGTSDLPRRRIRHPERAKILKLALDIRDTRMNSTATYRDTIH